MLLAATDFDESNLVTAFDFNFHGREYILCRRQSSGSVLALPPRVYIAIAHQNSRVIRPARYLDRLLLLVFWDGLDQKRGRRLSEGGVPDA